MNTFECLTQFYGQYDEDSRLRCRHGMVEFLTTMRYIEKYLRPGMRVVEIGAGTGRYSHTLAQQGYQVDAVELIQHNIDVFNANTRKGEKITIRQGNAMDLSVFADETYDITLLLGPMYHLFTEEEQKQALCEAIRVTKKGGVVFAAYCNNDATMITFCFEKNMIKHERYRALTDPVTFKLTSNPEELFQLYRKEDIDRLMEGFDTERLHYVGTDMATEFIRETVDAMDDDTFEIYMKYHFFICERPDMVGATHHMLDVFQKK
ncbi:MAG: methyltransferase domain-containing protein [Clostridia bacterium]|nr:methyltransferase domain-containing protein [Clostridia bacterium]